VPVLKEKGISNGSYGQSQLVSALIADFATMFLITALVAVLSSGLTLEILLIGVLFMAFFFVYRFGKIFFHRSKVIRRTMEELTGATSQIKVRVAFTMMLMFVALSESIGTEVILGAFLAGAIISLLKRPEDQDLEDQLNSIGYGFFIPIFFIMVGVDFNLGALIDSPQALILAPLLIIAALAVKFIPGLVFKLSYTWRETFGAGALLSVRLSLIIAASAIGLRLGIISESVNSAIVLVSVLTVSFMPAIFNKLIPTPKETEKQLLIVVGAGEMGVQVSEQLFRNNDHILVVADNNEQKARLERRNIPAIIAKADKGDPILDSYFEDARAMVCVYSDSERAFNVCKQARFEYGIDTVISRVDDPKRVMDFESIGVITVNAAMDQAAMLAMLTTNPSLYQLLIRTDSDKHICEVNVNKFEHFGKPIRDLNLPGDLVIVALQRHGKFINSTGGTQLEEGDKLSVMGTIACVDRALKIFE
jgi:Trk K+ transport system NAD-binding subunit